MTIIDVAGLEAFPDTFAFIDSTGDIGIMLGGQAWYPETATMLAGRAIRKYGPLEVLSPRTVTPEQVEAGAIAVIDRDGAHYMGGDKWETSGPVRRAHGRNLVTAALGAMGFEVSDG